jgi:hypothetical protein
MQQEVAAAAQWWTEQLKEQQPGVIPAINYTPLAAATIQAFQEALEQEIIKAIGSNWDVSNPYQGSGLLGRIIATDYGVSEESPLGLALHRAGIVDSRGWVQDERLPNKTIMWISPGSVTVAKGYGAGPVTIFGVAESELLR